MIVAGSASPLLLSSAGGYNLTKSLRFRSSASAYLNRTPASAGNRQIWTWSGWVKLGLLSPSSGWNCIFGAYSDDNNRTFFYTNNNSVSNTFYIFDVSGGLTTCNLISTQVLRDVSAWYHLVVSVDTTQATSSNRIKVYLNGSQITAFGTASYPSQNANLMVNNNVVHYIGASRYSGINLFHDGYLAEVNFIDGQTLTPSSFGETSTSTGVWIPKKYTGTYGTNGFYLPFTNTTSTSTLGKDFSGNSNTWTVNNISLTSGSTYDSMTDVPTLTSATTANYAVLNPLQVGAATTLTAANLNNDYSGTATDSMSFSSIAFESSNSNFYAEFTYVSSSLIGSGVPAVGICDVNTVGTGNISTTGTAVIYHDDGTKTVNGTNSSYGATWTTGDVIGVQINNGTVTFYKNGTTQGSAATGLTGTYKFVIRGRSGTSRTFTIAANFGQRPFGNLPSGALALNTFNLPTPTIGATASTTANKYFDVTLWTSNGGVQTITGVNFQPDFWWGKTRSSAGSHYLVDAVRGTSKDLLSNSTNAESTDANYVTAFNSDGFSMGTSQYSNGTTLVAWQWKANGSGVTNTAGSITSTVSANTTAGFSIVTYTGSGAAGTVGHGLGVAPAMIITKNRTTAGNSWIVWHQSLTGATANPTGYIYLDQTAAAGTTTNFYDGTAMTSTTFRWFGGNINVNSTSNNYVAYCFAQVAGYSAFGSYTGNGSSDGPFIYTGFRPRYVMAKVSSTTGPWNIFDSARGTYNVNTPDLWANSSNAETGNNIDFLSNGFKVRDGGGDMNGSGSTYIYMAFAESPLKFSNAR